LVDTGRDLACPALWQESLERSLARRGRPTRSSLALFQLRPERDLSRSDLVRESLMYSQLRRSAATRRASLAMPSAGGISVLALLAATTLPGLGSGAGRHAAGERVAFRGGEGAAGKRLRKGVVADAAVAPILASRAAALSAAPATDQAPPAEPAHPAVLPAVSKPIHTTSSSSTHSVLSPAPAVAPRHIAVARDAAAGGAAHAQSGGAATAVRHTSAIAPRVPAEPQPSGHPSTGGGVVESDSHGAVAPAHAVTPRSVARTHPLPATHPATGTHRLTTSHPVAAAHPVGAAHPVPTTHPVTTTHPVATAHPVASAHPVATVHPVTSTHPVATAHPKPAPTPAPPPAASGGYTNPLAGASVTPERIDQGVDYGGSGTLGAIGDGKITYVGTSGTGWPGAFIEFQLSSGPDAGRYVYYAESISPAAGLHVGQTVRAGQPIASINGQIEIGWGSGVGSQPAAQADGQWGSGSDSANVATPDGKSFSALVASLGGPAGKVQG
jgi:hypothetical protein